MSTAAAAGCGGSHGSTAAGSERYTDKAGWSLTYPAGMHLERSEVQSRIYVHEVTVASFAPRKAIRSGSTREGSWLKVDPPRPEEGDFPADGIAFRVFQQEGGPAPALETPESRFPLQLSRFQRSPEYGEAKPVPLGQGISADGRNYAVFAWIGANASEHARTELTRVVSSLAFPQLEPGRVVGYGFSVLEQESHYPAGSFTRVRAESQPFYLVRAPGGFYAVGWRWNTIEGGYKARCALELDAVRKEFFCTNIHARWDRVGRPLVVPVGAQPDPLNLAVTKVAWDGHVLLFPGSASFARRELAAELWPGWR